MDKNSNNIEKLEKQIQQLKTRDKKEKDHTVQMDKLTNKQIQEKKENHDTKKIASIKEIEEKSK